jgi:hypothetical protein
MSIVANNLLNQAVKQIGLTKPSEILDFLNEGITNTLHQTYEESSVKDGMDISICSLNMKEMTLQYAGAYNPMYLFRDGQLTIYRGDRFPVGLKLAESTWTDGFTSSNRAALQLGSAWEMGQDVDGDGGLDFYLYGNGGLRMTITTSGGVDIYDLLNVGGGYGTSGTTLSANGNISTNGAISADGTVTGGNLTTGGSLTRTALATGSTSGASINGSGQFIRTPSSARYKQDIQDITYNYEDVLALSPKTFRLKDEAELNPDSKVYGGFIAEEVDQIEGLKVFVNYTTQEDGSVVPDGVAYGEMVSALVSAIKHQDARIQALEAQVQALSS